jgi:hypothetical protein
VESRGLLTLLTLVEPPYDDHESTGDDVGGEDCGETFSEGGAIGLEEDDGWEPCVEPGAVSTGSYDDEDVGTRAPPADDQVVEGTPLCGVNV